MGDIERAKEKTLIAKSIVEDCKNRRFTHSELKGVIELLALNLERINESLNFISIDFVQMQNDLENYKNHAENNKERYQQAEAKMQGFDDLPPF